MTYIIQRTTTSRCSLCKQPLELLCPEEPDGNPMFYICFNHKRVFQIGVGPVKED
jgi:hypothetical protein